MKITLDDLFPPTAGHLREAAYAALAGDAAAPGGRRHGRKNIEMPDANGVSKKDSYRDTVAGRKEPFRNALARVQAGIVTPSVQSEIRRPGKKPRLVADNAEDKRAVTGHMWTVLGDGIESRLHPGQYGGREASRIMVACPRTGATSVDHVAWSLHRDIHDGYRYCVSADLVDAFGSLPTNLVVRELRRAGHDGDAAEFVWSYLRRNAIDRLNRSPITFATEGGVEQGNVLSAAVLNLCLAPILRRVGTRLDVRAYTYVDDIYIMTKSLPDAEDALRRLKAMIRDAGLKPFPTTGPKQPEIVDTSVSPVLVLQVCLVDGRGIRLSYGAVLRAWLNAHERGIVGHVGPTQFRKLAGCQAASRCWLRHSGVLDIPEVLPEFDEKELKNEFPSSSELGESKARTWVGAREAVGTPVMAVDGDEGGGAEAAVGARARTEAMAMIEPKAIAVVGADARTEAVDGGEIPEPQSTRGRRGSTRGTEAEGEADGGRELDTPPHGLMSMQVREVTTEGDVLPVEKDIVYRARSVDEDERGGGEGEGPDTLSYPSAPSITSDVQASNDDREIGPIEKIKGGGSRSDPASAVRGRLGTAGGPGRDLKGRVPSPRILRVSDPEIRLVLEGRGSRPDKTPRARIILDLTGLLSVVGEVVPGVLRCIVNRLLAVARVGGRVTVQYRPAERWLAVDGILGDPRDDVYVQHDRRVLADGSVQVSLHRRKRFLRPAQEPPEPSPVADVLVVDARVIDLPRRLMRVRLHDHEGWRSVVVVADSPSRQVASVLAMAAIVEREQAAVVALRDRHGLLHHVLADNTDSQRSPSNTALAMVRASLRNTRAWHRDGCWMVGRLAGSITPRG